jgi:hypothetical protein
LRNVDPRFHGERFRQFLAAIEELIRREPKHGERVS